MSQHHRCDLSLRCTGAPSQTVNSGPSESQGICIFLRATAALFCGARTEERLLQSLRCGAAVFLHAFLRIGMPIGHALAFAPVEQITDSDTRLSVHGTKRCLKHRHDVF